MAVTSETTTITEGGPDAPAPEECENGALDAAETDVDCGGACAPCVSGARCEVGRDCFSGYCVANVCGPEGLGPALPGIVAYFDFQETFQAGFPDLAGANPGQLQPDVTLVEGPFGASDRALGFPLTYSENDHGYAWVAHSEAWNLAEGSIDFWFWVPETLAPNFGRDVGIVARDAVLGAEPGHLNVGIYGTGEAWTVGLRQQEQFAGHPETNAHTHAVCTEPELATQTWHHIGFNFGGGTENTLTLNGARLSHVACWGVRSNFQQGYASFGIDGNHEPLVLGHGSAATAPGGHYYDFETRYTSDSDRRFAGGRVAHVRVSSVRRDFTALYALMAPSLAR